MSSRGFQAGQQAEVPLLWFEAFGEPVGFSVALSALKGRMQHIFSRNRRELSKLGASSPRRQAKSKTKGGFT